MYIIYWLDYTINGKAITYTSSVGSTAGLIGKATKTDTSGRSKVKFYATVQNIACGENNDGRLEKCFSARRFFSRVISPPQSLLTGYTVKHSAVFFLCVGSLKKGGCFINII